MAAVVQKWTSEQAREAATDIVRRLAGEGHVAYFAGGCVRDELLGLEPTDYDIATDAQPQQIAGLFRRTAAVGASFGVMLVKEGGVTVEVATFRSDGPYTDRRRPDHIEFSDAEHDARRRDFTINALFLDPLAAEDSPTIHGHAIDFVGGLADLRARVVRAVGDPAERLAEDHLRALRAVRFAARFGFEIEPGTAEAIRAHAGALAGVSRERIGEELRRMLVHPGRAGAVALLEELGLAGVVLGGGPAPGERDAIKRLEGGASFAASLAAWVLDGGRADAGSGIPATVSRLRRALCLSNEESGRLRDVLGGVLEMEAGWGALPPAARKRRASAGWFADATAVVAARDAGLGRLIEADVRTLAGDGIGLAPAPLIGGDDLLAAGFAAGPAFARILSSVYDAQLEGRVDNKADALRLAAELRHSRGV